MKRRRVLISAGPTREWLDPVRYLSNESTGYLGARLAAEALARGHRVTVVCGPASEPPPRGARVVPVTDSRQMERAMRREARAADAVIMAAAVADFRPANPSRTKLARRGTLRLRLEATPDIVARLPRRPGQVVAGFALETGRVLARAERKLREKRLDLIVAQDAAAGSPFGRRPVRAWLLGKDGSKVRLGRAAKPVIARALLDKVEALWYVQSKHFRPAHAD
jgi:phosphopantothenoylcysteine decarboxylase / phosphopantothenate---cysteine ligase